MREFYAVNVRFVFSPDKVLYGCMIPHVVGAHVNMSPPSKASRAISEVCDESTGSCELCVS